MPCLVDPESRLPQNKQRVVARKLNPAADVAEVASDDGRVVGVAVRVAGCIVEWFLHGDSLREAWLSHGCQMAYQYLGKTRRRGSTNARTSPPLDEGGRSAVAITKSPLPGSDGRA